MFTCAYLGVCGLNCLCIIILCLAMHAFMALQYILVLVDVYIACMLVCCQNIKFHYGISILTTLAASTELSCR